MDPSSVAAIVNPPVSSRSVRRGPLCLLPQGMTTSVALAEAFLITLMWKLHALVKMKASCYVDDLNLAASTPQDLERIPTTLWDFASHFGLETSLLKTQPWTSGPKVLKEIAQRWGISCSDSLSTLGGSWILLRP